jgi:methyl-accepting chemotaxis protein
MVMGGLTDRHVVGQRIGDLADEGGLAPRAEELQALAQALRAADTDGLGTWADLDLLAAYGRPESVAVDPAVEHKAWGWLEAGLGALVFLPLLFTWHGLTQASSAYGALTGDNPKAAARPFLQLWQSGFEGHLAGLYTFGTVAMSATVAIAVLFALALVHSFRKAAVDRREEAARRAAEQLMARLVPALSRAQLVLNEHRMSSPVRFAAELTGAAKTLTRLGNRAAKTNAELAAAAETVGAALKEAERQLGAVGTSVRPLEEAAGRIETAVSGSGAMVREALEEVRAVNGEVRDSLGRAGERVEDSVTVLAASQRSFTTGVEVAADVSAQVLGRLDAAAEESARLFAAAEEAVRESRKVAEETQDAVRDSQSAAQETRTVVRAMAQQAGALRETAEKFAQLVAVVQNSGGVAVPVPRPPEGAPPAPPVPSWPARGVDLGKPGDAGEARGHSVEDAVPGRPGSAG